LKITKKDIKDVDALMDLYSPAVVRRHKKKENFKNNKKWILKAQKKKK
jgi:hypothetical protein|tara:strand:- start:1243 stop:1386 length:144 start_codon:yes stop_codon:yes gene_type:complete